MGDAKEDHQPNRCDGVTRPASLGVTLSEVATGASPMLARVVARRVLQSVRSRKGGVTGDRGGPTTGDRWHDLLDASQAWADAKSAATGPRVLIATDLGGYQQGTVLESLLAVALTLRGARPEILLCDADLPACQLTKYAKISPRKLVRTGTAPVCPPCVAAGHDAFDALGLPVRHLGDQLEVSDVLAIKAQVDAMDVARLGDPDAAGGSAVVEHARAGALRYYGLGDLRTESRGEEVLRLYLRAALTTELSMRRLLEREDFDVAVFHHGIYVPQGIVGEVCRDPDVRVVNSNPAYRKQTLIFSHGDSCHKTMLSESTSRWADDALDARREEPSWTTTSRSRRTGEGDWIHFNTAPDEAAQSFYAETGLDPEGSRSSGCSATSCGTRSCTTGPTRSPAWSSGCATPLRRSAGVTTCSC